ncbi:MAG TPA: glycoside hydrolase family 2 TIM barrel-domain containing protein [Lacipirellulaceae bacterium]|nr:glycoside hydrolase family 2 TIM barrel-domain containing protein [Lacipirellulaceae bacterium]
MASLLTTRPALLRRAAGAAALALLSLTLGQAPASDAGAAPGAKPVAEAFETGWRFLKGDAPGAEAVEFDDAAWRTLDVPHDWSIEGPYDRDAAVGRGGAYLPAGVGWYRKTFTLPAQAAKKSVFVEFDGVMSHSDVWINGEHVGQRPSGYTSFRYDVTDHVQFGDETENVLAVKVDASRQPASRWYAGAGIYRHVRILLSDPVRVAHGATFVTTPSVTSAGATVRVATTVLTGGANVGVQVRILDPEGAEVGSGQTSWASIEPGVDLGRAEIELTTPQFWSPAAPKLYTAVVDLTSEGYVLQTERTRFGIREFRFESDTGFWLNGQNIKIKGVCLHHDGGAVGAAVPKAVWRRRLQTLKGLGVNAIRTAHNPASPEFLDLCDELGFLVMHEVFDSWNAGKNHAQQGYNRDFKEWWERDLRDAVVRDRNHPSIILYSAGNEIRDNLRAPAAFDQFRAMKAIYDELDGTRPVTMAEFRPNQSGVYESGFSELMDVVGHNYREAELVRAHRDKPTRKILGTENGHDRRIWLMMRDNPFYSGQFLWTGIEYMGESDWPYTTWGDALVDRAGFVKPLGLQRQSWWSDAPMVAIVRDEAASGGASGRGAAELVDHWTPRDPDTYDQAEVSVYSNCDEVELVLNGESIGKEPMPADASPAEFSLAYEPGTLEAVGYQAGREVARQKLSSAGEPARLRLVADRATCAPHFDDVVHVVVEVVDDQGVVCPWAAPKISLTIDGPGKLVGIDNADPQSHESFQAPERRAYRGRVLAIVRPTASDGTVTIQVSAQGLESAAATIEASP